MKNTFHYNKPFILELGDNLPELQFAYHTYGSLNTDKDNVIWICHALTASSDAADWWDGLVGKNKPIDPEKYFIVCANILGSCYGTTGPTSINPNTGTSYGINFPLYTIKDMLKAHHYLMEYLGIETIQLLIGGSMGGYQALEWTLTYPTCIKSLFLLATSPAESAWGKAIHTAQRMAIKADPDWQLGIIGTGDNGLKAARGIGMLTYRNYNLFQQQQQDDNPAQTHEHKASSYIQYQANKLAQRFDALSYYKLTEAMDSHNIARGRSNSIEAVLKTIDIPTLIIGITSDILCPVSEQKFLAQHIRNAQFVEIDSPYGHDGFLIEADKIGAALLEFMDKYINNL